MSVSATGKFAGPGRVGVLTVTRIRRATNRSRCHGWRMS
jgi:hypothetical protein